MDDGSPDDTVEKIRNLEGRSPSGKISDILIRIIRLDRNYGQQAAVFCGLEQSRGERVLTMDDDLQHPAEFIPEILRSLRDCDLVFALPASDRRTRFQRGGSRMRDLFFRFVLKMPKGISPGSFRGFSRKAVDSIKGRGREFVYVSALLFIQSRSLKIRTIHYPILCAAPESESRIRGRARIGLYLKLVYYFGILPPLPQEGGNPAIKPYGIKEEL